MTNPNPMKEQPPALEPAAVPASMPVASKASPANSGVEALTPEQAVEILVRDPVGFVRRIVDEAAQIHLTDLKEEAELRGALNVFRKAHPDAVRFEPFIMQEVVKMIQDDEDGAIAPWDQLLEQALERFKVKFQDMVKENTMPVEEQKTEPPFVEGAMNRVLPEAPVSFTREQISKMSLNEFLKNESAINQALQEKRIR